MAADLKPSAQRVKQALAALGYDFDVVEFPQGTRTSEEAAAAAGCELGQIAKSLVFRAAKSDRSVMVIASGPNRVDEKKVGRLLGEKIKRADADFVRRKTGFAIGGVPPVAHLEPPVTFLEQDLLSHDEVWSAAGTPNAIFRLKPGELLAITGARAADVKRD